MIKTSILNVALRSLTVAGKAAFMLMFVKYSSPEEVGIFGIFVVTIAISIFVLGMDFYRFNTREILAIKNEDFACLVRDQAVFHGLVYLMALPLLIGVFIGGVIPSEFMFWFYILLVMEHLSQEFYRLFITLSRPVLANIVHFLRSGSWTYVLIFVILSKEGFDDLNSIWLGWACGVSLSLVLSIYYLKDLDWKKVTTTPINWMWMKKGLKISFVFFCAAISLKLIEYADRYIIQYYHGNESVGVYTFYTQITSVIQSFITTGIIIILYPKIVKSFQDNKMNEYRFFMKKLMFNAVGWSFVLSLIASFAIFPVLSFIQKPIYYEYLAAYWVSLGTIVVVAGTAGPQYALYVRKMDVQLLIATFTVLCISVALNFLIVPMYGILGASISALLSSSILCMMFVFMLKFTPVRINQ